MLVNQSLCRQSLYRRRVFNRKSDRWICRWLSHSLRTEFFRNLLI